MTHWQHGKFFAYFPSISTFESMLGELYAASVSNPGFSVSSHSVGGLERRLTFCQWVCSPACTELEQVTMDWCAQLLGLSQDFHVSSKKGGGIIMVSIRPYSLLGGVVLRSFRRRHPNPP
jgi:aromatic-L-amino-acid decarboxylase